MLAKVIQKGMLKNLNKRRPVQVQESYPLRKYEITSKRMSVLNKTFMTHITTIMMGGKHSSELLGLGIEITKVQVSPCFKYLRVYWLSGKPNLENIDVAIVLNKAAGELRHEISSLSVLGRCPEITFVRDLVAEKSFIVESILSNLDLGNKSNSSESENVETEEQNDDDDDDDVDYNKFQQNVLSLDHDKITGRIISEIYRQKAIELEELKRASKDNPEHKAYNMDDTNFIQFNKKEFAKFYNRQRILERKLEKNSLGCEGLGMSESYDDNDDNEENIQDLNDMEEFENDEQDFCEYEK
ncbi:hypothetical protein RUM44_005718 [Polyplax serrata]|uniref:Ribosome-binding factor A, mitochondrial n=1 Tax=Polyplax serrata TaxID=468196 RepID=A0ABR1AXX1_POLSC